jgi:gamma-glutamylcyclotransferase (GGCT)/AIG2-like uncharacterized protein YtfP
MPLPSLTQSKTGRSDLKTNHKYKQMENLFAYGSLREEEVQKSIFGRILKGVPEKLQGYVVKRIEIEEEFGLENYPIITPTEDSSDCIEGIVYELTVQELQLSDTYEGNSYTRIEVPLQSKQLVWAYTAKL